MIDQKLSITLLPRRLDSVKLLPSAQVRVKSGASWPIPVPEAARVRKVVSTESASLPAASLDTPLKWKVVVSDSPFSVTLWSFTSVVSACGGWTVP